MKAPASESGSEGSEDGSGAMLAPDEIFDAVRGGARLLMMYDAPSNTFIGIVQNTTNSALSNIRIEVHLSNGAELGPTTPVNMAAGEILWVTLPSTPESFTGWTAHAEVGGGEGGGESGGEHGSGASDNERGGGERGSGGESRGEHGPGGERKGGG